MQDFYYPAFSQCVLSFSELVVVFAPDFKGAAFAVGLLGVAHSAPVINKIMVRLGPKLFWDSLVQILFHLFGR